MQRVFAMATTRPGDLWLRDFTLRLFHWQDGRMVPVTDVPAAFQRNVLSLYAEFARLDVVARKSRSQ